MRSTTTYRRGRVVILEVPFSDRSGSKRRPALVVSTATFHRKLRDVIVCPISSQPRYYERPGPGDHPLRHWNLVGLRYPSTARISNLVSVEKRIIKGSLGTLPAEDLERVEEGLREAFGL